MPRPLGSKNKAPGKTRAPRAIETTPRKPGGGRNSEITWQKRYEEAPKGSSPIHFLLPHTTGDLLEKEAKAQGTTVTALARQILQEAMTQQHQIL